MRTASPDTLRLLSSRRSVPAKVMSGPGPDDAQTDEILAIAARVPDHRMLAPFRFVVLAGEGKTRFAQTLRTTPTAPEGKRDKAAALYGRAPVVIGVVASLTEGHKTPVWEQELTVGAACQNLIVAAEAQGWAVQWLTGWPAYDETVRDTLSLGDNEKIAGFFFVGSSDVIPDDRKRPELSEIVTRYAG